MQILQFGDEHIFSGIPSYSRPGGALAHKVSEIVLTQAQLAEGVARLAAEIDRDLAGRPVLLVGILKGSVFFLCDLARRLRSPVTVDFLRVSSYGDSTRSSGSVRMTRDLSIDVADRDVLVVEDIVDTGRTLEKILDFLRTRSPASLRVCTLLRKKGAGSAATPVDYVGFEIDDRFVVGYGLDLAEAYRNLPYVAAIEEGDGE
ncbi:MAG TPA: hypoxanthine phosphoribosyltransferase [Thermoanaerobaculia bacterium]|nr:hypoxanthine phosphoribosyltransferase [Thermoanaerobaculia bacterium]